MNHKRSLPLSTRLFFSHLLVMLVAIITLVSVGKLSSSVFFLLHLRDLEAMGSSLSDIRTDLIAGFDTAWNRSIFWAVLVGATAAGVLSYWVSRRITQPLQLIERVTQKFARGKLNERLPPSEIPELNRLCVNFNYLADNLQGVEQRRRELIGDLTHELRTPLTVIHGYLEGLAEDQIEPSNELYLSLIRETKRLERLVNDMQELSKAEAGYLPIHLAPFSVKPLLLSLVERFSDQLVDDSLLLRLQCHEELPAVLADGDRLEQVLVNLLGNALTYTEKGSITLKAWDEGKRLWIAVIDTGSGIAPQDLPHVFERFWRSGTARTRNSRGSGIGLAISRRLVELQGGAMQVESRLSKGTTFRFFLPLA